MTPIRFFVDDSWRRRYTHIPLLFPFWGNVVSEKTPYSKKLFETHSYDTAYYRLTKDLAEADAVLLPYRYNVLRERDDALIREAAATAKKARKPILINGSGDIEYEVSIPHAIVLRVGGYRFLKKPNEIHIPFYAEDILESECGGQLSVRKKGGKPVIGFSGWAGIRPLSAAKAIAKELPDRLHGVFDTRYRACKKGIFFRRSALAALRRSPLVEPNFIERATYSAHTATASNDPKILRRQFVDNLLESDYGLDVRGDANASARLFEICSLGRIPVILDTERNFPFEGELDYSSFSLVVDFRDLPKLPQRIADFHASLSPEKFEAMQRAAREAYRNYFRIDSATVHLMRRVRQCISSTHFDF